MNMISNKFYWRTLTPLSLIVYLAACSQPTIVQTDTQPQHKILPISLVAVTPIYGATNSDEVYQRTARLIKALRGVGFEVGAVRDTDDPVPGSGPYLLVGASIVDPKYCLETIVSGRRLPEDKKIQFEYRQDRYNKAIKLNDEECAARWATGIRLRVIEQWAKQ